MSISQTVLNAAIEETDCLLGKKRKDVIVWYETILIIISIFQILQVQESKPSYPGLERKKERIKSLVYF